MSISSSYMLERGSIWLIIHLDPAGNITSVEDHDHYSGGHINPRNNETQEQLFIRSAQQRGFAFYEIELFLKASKARTQYLNTKPPANIADLLDTLPIEYLKSALDRRPT
ncbi:MAG TPA: hypothetical protein VGK47_01340 [Nitrososphaeraceae archaeon]